MGRYIYKTEKIDRVDGLDGKVGFYEFWYKPYWVSSSRPSEMKSQHMRDVITDRLKTNHPEGLQYACFAPLEYISQDSCKKAWSKTKKVALYKVPEDEYKGISPVLGDEGRQFEITFDIKNVVGVIWGPKNGKKRLDTSPRAILNVIKERYFSDPERTTPREAAIKNNMRIMEEVREKLPHVYEIYDLTNRVPTV